MTEWFRQPGANLFLSEQRALAGLLAQTPGENVLQMGLETLNYAPDLNAGRRLWREAVSEEESSRLMHCLSFADGCMHVVVVPHLLECMAQPVLALREASRLLRAGGRLFVIGFYPMSFSRRLPSSVRRRRHSPAHLTRILSLLHFNQVHCYALTALPWPWLGRVPGLQHSFILSVCRHDLALTPPLREQSPSEVVVPAC